MDEIIGRGTNIKCYDKIKLTHALTGHRLHFNEFQWKGGSYNLAVTTHKVRDQTDWYTNSQNRFVALKPSGSDTSYHFVYGDEILLSSSHAKKYLHLTTQFQSQISKNYEVSLCDVGNGQQNDLEDQWIIQLAQNGQDQYWRVGEMIKIKNKITDSYLCSHRRKIRQNDDNQVYGSKAQGQNAEKGKKDKPEQKIQVKTQLEENVWIVSQIIPFIYSVPITQKKQIKLSEQAQELIKLNKSKASIPKKAIKKKDDINQILKIQNQRLQQLQEERKKLQQAKDKRSCWKKYLCCCCPDGQYSRLQ